MKLAVAKLSTAMLSLSVTACYYGHSGPSYINEPIRADPSIPSCNLELSSPRASLARKCGAPACRPTPDRWIYPSYRVSSSTTTRYMTVELDAESVRAIRPCDAKNCCALDD